MTKKNLIKSPQAKTHIQKDNTDDDPSNEYK